MSDRPVLINDHANEEFLGFALVVDVRQVNNRWTVFVSIDNGRAVGYPMEQARDLFPIITVYYIIHERHQRDIPNDIEFAWVIPYNRSHYYEVWLRRLFLNRERDHPRR